MKARKAREIPDQGEIGQKNIEKVRNEVPGLLSITKSEKTTFF